MIVPAFLLRRLYVRGSLRNTEAGLEFDLRNTLGGGYAEAMLPLRIDGEEVALAEASFRHGDAFVLFSEVSKERPFSLALNLTTTIRANGRSLAEGNHRIDLGFVVVGLGRLSFDVTDQIGSA
jgi:hypothetical protein